MYGLMVEKYYRLYDTCHYLRDFALAEGDAGTLGGIKKIKSHEVATL